MIEPIILVGLSDDADCEKWEPLQLPDDHPGEHHTGSSDDAADVTLEVRQTFPYGESLERLRRENSLFRGCNDPDEPNNDATVDFRKNSFDADEDFPHSEPPAEPSEKDDLETYLEGLSRDTNSRAGLTTDDTGLPWNPNDPVIREMDYMEAVVAGAHDDDDMLFSILPEPFDIDALSEDEAVAKLKVILAGAALYNIAFHICDHFTAHDVLRLIYDHYADEVHIHPGFVGTGWTTNYDTSDHCKTCEDELTAKWDEERAELGLSENDPPF